VVVSDRWLVDSADGVETALGELASLDEVGVDVERADGDRYHRAAALVQVGGAGRVVLLDPLAVPDLEGLHRFLQARTSVLHAMENDLEPLASLGVRPPVCEDTSLAAAVLGHPLGLETLLTQLLGVSVEGDKKALQRADWEARPLSEQLLAYAAGDVAYLPELWRHLQSELTRLGRVSWYREEREAALARPAPSERRSWRHTKGIGRLSSLAKARLRALWRRREALGDDTDTAPGRIASDRVLVDLAEHPPSTPRELPARGVRRRSAGRFGQQLVDAAREAETEGPLAPEPTRAVPSNSDRAQADRLRALRSERAEALGIDPGVLCPGRVLASAVASRPASPDELRQALGLRDWQWGQLGSVFCTELGLSEPFHRAPPQTS
jgi:ribonuclease D